MTENYLILQCSCTELLKLQLICCEEEGMQNGRECRNVSLSHLQLLFSPTVTHLGDVISVYSSHKYLLLKKSFPEWTSLRRLIKQTQYQTDLLKCLACLNGFWEVANLLLQCLFVSDSMRKGGIVIKNVKGLLLWAPGVKGGESQGDFSELANRKLGSCRSWELEQTGVSN